MGDVTNAYNMLLGKPEGKKLLGRARRRWQDNIRRDLREIAWRDVDWMYLVQDMDQWRAVLNTVIKLWVT
jgi:hypothetical protein